MIMNSRAPELKAKEEQMTGNAKITKASSSSTPWSKLKDPRIVRVSRAFGGKDRHSKVCTVRGLRDRRVRLSVPTAIQLYDLQERLGLSQPSKVIDWLLDIARHEIDELPPLQLPPVNFTIPQLHKQGLSIDKSADWNKPLDLSKRNVSVDISSNSVCARSNNHPSLEGSVNNVVTQNSVPRWDPSSLSLSNSGSNETELHSFNLLPLSSTQSYFPGYVSAGEFDPKQVNFQMLGSTSQIHPYSNSHITQSYIISQPIRPFHLSMTPNIFPLESEPSKEN